MVYWVTWKSMDVGNAERLVFLLSPICVLCFQSKEIGELDGIRCLRGNLKPTPIKAGIPKYHRFYRWDLSSTRTEKDLISLIYCTTISLHSRHPLH